MITFQETLQQPKPSAQLKPVPKPVPVPKPSFGQKILTGIGNVANAIKKDISSTKLTGILPNSAAFKNFKAVPTFGDAYKTLVKKDSTIDKVVQGKFSEVPRAIKSDIQYQNENFKKDTVIATKAMKGGPDALSPEEKKYSKERTVGLLGTVDAGAAAQKVAQTDDYAGRIIEDIKKAVPVRKQQQELYSAELRERAAKVAQAGQSLTGEEAHIAQKAALKGELAPEPDFQPIRANYKSEEVGKMKDMIESNAVLRPLEKVDAKDALDKLLDGKVPQKAEIDKLQTVFGKSFGETVSTKSLTGVQKVVNKVAEVLNVPRALNSSIDLSASGRQGVFAIPSHPVAAAKSFVKQFSAAASDKGYEKVMQSIQQKPSFKIARDVGVAFSDTSGALSGKEEAYMSNLAEKIPVLGKLVKASDRAYSAFLNNFRSELFDGFYKNAEKLGRGNDLKLLKNYAGLVNNMTGRGDLGVMNRYAPLLNGAFFSPRLMASRIQLMNPAYYARLEAPVRKEAMKSLVAFVGTGLSILGMAKAAGAAVGTDPRSSDFGKIRIGNTRYDIWGGFSQYAVLLSRLVMNESVSSTSGKVTKFGEGYKPTTRDEIVGRFLESKLAPVPSFTHNAFRGSDVMGEDFSLKNEAKSRLTPFFVQDFMKIVEEQGLPVGALMSVPGFFGIGGNTYDGVSKFKTNSKFKTSSSGKFKVGPSVLR